MREYCPFVTLLKILLDRIPIKLERTLYAKVNIINHVFIYKE